MDDTTSMAMERAYDGSYYTIVGPGGDLQEWMDGYQQTLREEGMDVEIKEWINFTGRDMNEKYRLTGDNRYPNDLQFLAFSLDGFEQVIGKLAMFKLANGDRWFDDIVDNDVRRENEKRGDYDDDDL